MKKILCLLLFSTMIPLLAHAQNFEKEEITQYSDSKSKTDLESLSSETTGKLSEVNSQLDIYNVQIESLKKKIDTLLKNSGEESLKYSSLIDQNKNDLKQLSEQIGLIQKEFLQITSQQNQNSQSLNENQVFFENKINEITARLDVVGEKVENIEKLSLNEQITKIDSAQEQLKVVKDSISEQFSMIEKLSINLEQQNKKNSTVTNLLSIAVIVLFLLAIAMIFFFLRNIRPLVYGTRDSVDKIQKYVGEESIKFDSQFAQLIQNQLEILSDPSSQEPIVASDEGEHSFQLKVATEITRMRIRISNMPDSTTGIKALSKALDRLEEELNSAGYEIVDLVGKSYNEGMLVKPKFIKVDNLVKGEEVITKVITPQLNYKGVMIQTAEVEVSIGE